MRPSSPQKLLLIAESELNRANLADDLADLSLAAHALTARAESVGSLTSSAIGLVAGLVALQQGGSERRDQGAPWLSTLLTGTNLLSRLWHMWNRPEGGR